LQLTGTFRPPPQGCGEHRGVEKYHLLRRAAL
jgi:hypothetical protein